MIVNHAYLVKLAHRASSGVGSDPEQHSHVAACFVGELIDYLQETGKAREADDICRALGCGWEYKAPSATPGDPKGDLYKFEGRA